MDNLLALLEKIIKIRKEIEVGSKDGKTVREIAQQRGMPKSTVQDTLGRVKKHGVLKSLARSGRKRKTTPRIDRKILTRVENSVRPNATDIAKQLREIELVNISATPRPFRNRLHEYSLHGRALDKKQLLTKRHTAKRVAFAKKYQKWTVDDWKEVLWLDEKKNMP